MADKWAFEPVEGSDSFDLTVDADGRHGEWVRLSRAEATELLQRVAALTEPVARTSTGVSEHRRA